jgi:hypothetical protein
VKCHNYDVITRNNRCLSPTSNAMDAFGHVCADWIQCSDAMPSVLTPHFQLLIRNCTQLQLFFVRAISIFLCNIISYSKLKHIAKFFYHLRNTVISENITQTRPTCGCWQLLVIRYTAEVVSNKPTAVSAFLQAIGLPFCSELTITTPGYPRLSQAHESN